MINVKIKFLCLGGVFWLNVPYVDAMDIYNNSSFSSSSSSLASVSSNGDHDRKKSNKHLTQSYGKKQISSNKEECSDLMNAIISQDFEGVEKAIKKGVDLNEYNKEGFTPLVMAVICDYEDDSLTEKKKLKIIKLLLKQKNKDGSLKVDINAKTEKLKNTALRLAVIRGYSKIVKKLIESGADINLTNDGGYTPFALAIYNADVEMVDLLLDNGAEITEESFEALNKIKDQKTRESMRQALNNAALFRAIYNKGIEQIKESIKAGANLNGYNKEGFTPLVVAVIYDYEDDSFKEEEKLEIIKLLLEQKNEDGSLKVDINAKTTKKGNTALLLAVIRGYKYIVEKLIESGADINLKNGKGHTPLALAIRNADVEMVDLLLDNRAKITEKSFKALKKIKDQEKRESLQQKLYNVAIFGAAASGNIDQIQLALDNGQDVNAIDEEDNTPLIIAIQTGQSKDFIENLIEKGANVFLKNKEGKTAIDLAANDDVRNYLNECKKKKESEFLAAAETGKLDEAKNLLDFGVDVNVVDEKSKSALMLVLLNQKIEKDNLLEMVKLLINRGADINAKNKNNQTPLMMVVRTRDIKFVNLLLYSDAEKDSRREIEIDATDKNGWTAAMYAAQRTDEMRGSIMDALKDYGAKFDERVQSLKNNNSKQTLTNNNSEQILTSTPLNVNAVEFIPKQ